jgi:H+/Cl- antiporter ClcA
VVRVLIEFSTGLITGLLAGLLMASLDFFINFAWGDQVLNGFASQAPIPIQFLIPISCGLGIGLLRTAGADPLPELHVTLGQLRQKQQQNIDLDLRPRFSHLLLGSLALLGGGCLGPEALLSRAVAEWHLKLHQLKKRFGFSIGPVASIWRWIAGLSGGLCGFGVLGGFSRFGAGEQGVAYLWPPNISQLAIDLGWAFVIGLLGGILGLLFLLSRKLLGKRIQKLGLSQLALGVGTGLVLAIVNLWQPLALFSGEQQISHLLQGRLVGGASELLLFGSLKIALCVLCLSSGWVGGLFFPLIIGASSIGLGFHQVLSSISSDVAVSAMVAGIQAAVLAQPWVPLFITVTVLKGHGLLAAAVGSLVGWRLRRQGSGILSRANPHSSSHSLLRSTCK